MPKRAASHTLPLTTGNRMRVASAIGAIIESRSDHATVALLILIAGLFCFDVMRVLI